MLVLKSNPHVEHRNNQKSEAISVLFVGHVDWSFSLGFGPTRALVTSVQYFSVSQAWSCDVLNWVAKSAIPQLWLSFISVKRIWSWIGIVDDMVVAKPRKHDTRVLNSCKGIPVYSRQYASSFSKTSEMHRYSPWQQVLWSSCAPQLLSLTAWFSPHVVSWPLGSLKRHLAPEKSPPLAQLIGEHK